MAEVADSARDLVTLLFLLENERCMIAADCVIKVVGAHPVIRLPMLADDIAGLVVLGGEVVPVLALRKLLKLPWMDGELVLVTIETATYALEVDRVLQIGRFADQDARFIQIDALLKRFAARATASALASVDMAEGSNLAAQAPSLANVTVAVQTETSRELLPLGVVLELCETLPIVTVPDPVFAGAVVHQGRLLPLASLDALLGREAADTNGPFVIVDVEGCQYALAVKRVIGLCAEVENVIDLRGLFAHFTPAAQPMTVMPQTRPHIADTRYLLVELASRTCALPIDSVAHIYSGCRVLQPPSDMGRAVCAVTVVGGRVLPVINLASLLGIGAECRLENFIEIKSRQGGTVIAVVERVLGIVSIAQDALMRQADDTAISAVVRLGGKLVWILAVSYIAGGSRRDAA